MCCIKITKKIGMIITQSISRFARNTVDCLTTFRKLKALKNPVEIYFKKERLSSLDEKTDMVLNLMASIAQEDSRSISANMEHVVWRSLKEHIRILREAGIIMENDAKKRDAEAEGIREDLSAELELLKEQKIRQYVLCLQMFDYGVRWKELEKYIV